MLASDGGREIPDGRGRGGLALLELRGVAKHFGAIEALRGIDLALEPGEVATPGLSSRGISS